MPPREWWRSSSRCQRWGALVIYQIHLFRVLTGVGSPLRSDTVFFATLVTEGIAALAVIFRGALKARDATR